MGRQAGASEAWRDKAFGDMTREEAMQFLTSIPFYEYVIQTKETPLNARRKMGCYFTDENGSETPDSIGVRQKGATGAVIRTQTRLNLPVRCDDLSIRKLLPLDKCSFAFCLKVVS